MLFGLDLNFGSTNHPSFWNMPRHQWLGPYSHFCLLQRHWNFLFQSHVPRFFTPVMDSALRLLYEPCLASCEPSMVLVWRGYFWMDGLKSTRAISSKLSCLAGCLVFISNDMLVQKNAGTQAVTLSQKVLSVVYFLPFYRGCLYINERKIGNFFRCQDSCWNGEI